MLKMQADVLAFHQKFDAAWSSKPKIDFGPDNEAIHKLRKALIDEEADEFTIAVNARDIVGVADAIADLIYVAIGAAVTYGIDLEPVWEEVHRANMAKVGGGVNEIHKIMKPEGWQPPDIAGCLAIQDWRGATLANRPKTAFMKMEEMRLEKESLEERVAKLERRFDLFLADNGIEDRGNKRAAFIAKFYGILGYTQNNMPSLFISKQIENLMNEMGVSFTNDQQIQQLDSQ